MINVRDLFSNNGSGTGSLGFSLRGSAESEYFVIDIDSRIITPPSSFENFGVESDENAERVWFECPRYVGDNMDLTECNVFINFSNANGEEDKFLVTDVSDDGDVVHFSWKLSRKVTRYKGTIKFVVCATIANKYGEIDNEWNTTLCTGAVLEGLEVESQTEDETTADVINQIAELVGDISTALNEVIEMQEAILEGGV